MIEPLIVLGSHDHGQSKWPTAMQAQLEERWALMARVVLGGGLRLTELLRLRVKDVDLEQEITG